MTAVGPGNVPTVSGADDTPDRGGLPISAEIVRAVAAAPTLWAPAIVAARRHLPRGWWRGGGLREADPWLRFRLETAYGASAAAPSAEDAVTWLRWCRAWPRVQSPPEAAPPSD